MKARPEDNLVILSSMYVVYMGVTPLASKGEVFRRNLIGQGRARGIDLVYSHESVTLDDTKTFSFAPELELPYSVLPSILSSHVILGDLKHPRRFIHPNMDYY
jgi:hypothetical protein